MATVYYTEDEHNTWNLFLKRQCETARSSSIPLYSEGLDRLGFDHKKIPNINHVSQKIYENSGFRLVLVDKLVPAKDFFLLLSNRKFPISISIRPPEQIEFYVSENPDLIHDYFGHCPFLSDEKFADFTQRFGYYAYQKLSKYPQVSSYLEKLYWYTLEFGLVRTPTGIKAYGAGIIPSKSEINNALNPALKNKFDFKLAEVMTRNFHVTSKQNIYYVIENMEYLYGMDFDSVDEAIDKDLKEYQCLTSKLIKV